MNPVAKTLSGMAQASSSVARSASRQRGIVLMLTLLAVILLVGMVLFVVNLGRQTTRRIDVQNVADSTAIAGAGWVARSLNTVAMNNVGITRLLSLVNVVDAMPDSVRFTKEEHEFTLEALKGARSRGIADAWVVNQVTDMEQELAAELNILNPLHNYFSSNDVSRQTFYDASGGRGEFYKAMEAMSELSVATMEGLGEYAQLNAVRGGKVNLDRIAPDGVTFITPLRPSIPYIIGEFDDFQNPVINGLLPTTIDDKEFNRGPWDTILGWRDLIGGNQPGYWVGGSGPTNSGGQGNVPIGSGAGGGGSGGQFVATGPRDPDSYRVYSFTRWMLDHVGNFAYHNLPHGRFMYWQNRLTHYKLGYLWPGTGIKTVIDPEFILDFDEAAGIADTDRSRIKETWFLAIEMKSKYKRGEAGFMSPGSYSYFVNNSSDRDTPRTVRLGGWSDPRTWNAEQIGDWQWRDEWDYTTINDPSIGIPLQLDAQGQPVSVPVYRVDTFIFLGINVGEEYEIRNPHNFTSKQNLPRPIDLDHGQLGHDNLAGRQQFLNYLAIAELTDRAVAWPSRFDGRKPYPFQVAIAQAHVFNDHSWDLWTQMWEAQLRPVENIDGWVDLMESGDSSVLPSDVTPEKVGELVKYLRSIRDLLDRMTQD